MPQSPTTSTPPRRLFVIGDGGWGTALAIVASSNGHDVTVWGHDEAQIEAVRREREHRAFLPAIPRDERIAWTHRFDGIGEADRILSVVPSKFLRGVLATLKKSFDGGVPIVSCTKGIDSKRLVRPTETIAEVFPEAPIAVLCGPSHAEEVARGLPATVVCASADEGLASAVQRELSGPTFRIYTSDDVTGVELAGALKNVIAIAAGICDGLGLGDNAKSALMVRGMAEMVRFATAFGARGETLAGLSGIGDLITTCISPHGRNRAVGEAIAHGKTLDDIAAATQQVAEGVLTVRSIARMAKKLEVEMPITEEVYRVLYRHKDPRKGVVDLMTRRYKSELE